MCQIEPQLCMLNKCKSFGILHYNLELARGGDCFCECPSSSVKMLLRT